MINRFFFTICLFIGLYASAQDSGKKIEIALQDFFSNDTVSVKIGQCQIIKNKILVSSDTGFGGVIGEIFDPNKLVVTFYGGKRIVTEKKCRINFDKNLILHLKLNNNKSTLSINIQDGKYIGLSKGKDNTFILLQKNKRFQYD